MYRRNRRLVFVVVAGNGTVFITCKQPTGTIVSESGTTVSWWNKGDMDRVTHVPFSCLGENEDYIPEKGDTLMVYFTDCLSHAQMLCNTISEYLDRFYKLHPHPEIEEVDFEGDESELLMMGGTQPDHDDTPASSEIKEALQTSGGPSRR